MTGSPIYFLKNPLSLINLGNVKDYRAVLAFKDKATMTQFVESGWEVGAHADAAAKAGDKGAKASGEDRHQFKHRIVFDDRSGTGLTGNRCWYKILERQEPELIHIG